VPDARDDNQHPEQAPLSSNGERIAKVRARLTDLKEDGPTPAVVWPRDLNDPPDPKPNAWGDDPNELRRG
jgi:hypothetical protein